MNKLLRKIRRAITRDEPGYYDMYLNPGEQFFARLYLHHIRKVLAAHPEPFGKLRTGFVEVEWPRSLKLLDAGCQAGRLAVPLALEGHRVVGVDTTLVGLRRCRRHAAEAGVKKCLTPFPAPLELIRANLTRWLPAAEADSFDVVLCAEVLYLRENWRELLRGLIRLLRPGGLGFISHRPTDYYLAEAHQHQDQEAVRTLLSGAGEGKVIGSYYNWQNREDLRRIYEESGMEVLRIIPIGRLSQKVNPEKITEEQRNLLFQEEISLPDDGEGGRYLLVCGKKR